MPVKVGVIGIGAMGRNHARVYADLAGAQLVGLADQDAAAAANTARRYGTRPYSDFRQLLDEAQPDAVSVAVPTVSHLPVALEVIRRGIHLLVEKPLALSVEEGSAIMRAAEERGVLLMVGHIERFNPAVMALKAKLDNREIGRIFQIDAHRQGPFPARVMDIGVTVDLAVHDLDVMRYITGAEITRVYAETERHFHASHEDLLTGLIRLSDQTIGTLKINWLTPTKIRELYVLGEKGMFRVDYLTQDLYLYENGFSSSDRWDALDVFRGVSEGRMIRQVVTKVEPLRAELEAFLAAVRGEAPVTVTGLASLKALEAAQALVTSGLENRVIQLAQMEEHQA